MRLRIILWILYYAFLRTTVSAHRNSEDRVSCGPYKDVKKIFDFDTVNLEKDSKAGLDAKCNTLPVWFKIPECVQVVADAYDSSRWCDRSDIRDQRDVTNSYGPRRTQSSLSLWAPTVVPKKNVYKYQNSKIIRKNNLKFNFEVCMFRESYIMLPLGIVKHQKKSLMQYFYCRIYNIIVPSTVRFKARFRPSPNRSATV
ncbi:hypothetical protein BDF21DRAFT_398388 [Thamnidium elegans]|nr:hypothetical protein BDF21DRAFT_398388 [Thamnidium elegans]